MALAFELPFSDQPDTGPMIERVIPAVAGDILEPNDQNDQNTLSDDTLFGVGMCSSNMQMTAGEGYAVAVIPANPKRRKKEKCNAPGCFVVRSIGIIGWSLPVEPTYSRGHQRRVS